MFCIFVLRYNENETNQPNRNCVMRGCFVQKLFKAVKTTIDDNDNDATTTTMTRLLTSYHSLMGQCLLWICTTRFFLVFRLFTCDATGATNTLYYRFEFDIYWPCYIVLQPFKMFLRWPYNIQNIMYNHLEQLIASVPVWNYVSSTNLFTFCYKRL